MIEETTDRARDLAAAKAFALTHEDREKAAALVARAHEAHEARRREAAATAAAHAVCDGAELARIEALPTAEERKQARDKLATRQARRNDGKDWTPVVGTDNYEYPAWVYRDHYGNERKCITREQKRDAEARFKAMHGTDWQ